MGGAGDFLIVMVGAIGLWIFCAWGAQSWRHFLAFSVIIGVILGMWIKIKS